MKLDITNELQVFAHNASGLEIIGDDVLSKGYSKEDWKSQARHKQQELEHMKEANDVFQTVINFDQKNYFLDMLVIGKIFASINNVKFFERHANLQSPILVSDVHQDGEKTEQGHCLGVAEIILKFDNHFDKGFLIPITISYTTAEYVGVVNRYDDVYGINYTSVSEPVLKTASEAPEPFINNVSVGDIKSIEN